MKRSLSAFLVALVVAGSLQAASPSGWTVASSGPYIPQSGGAELKGRSILGLGQTPLTNAAIGAPATAWVALTPYQLVSINASVSYTAMSISPTSSANENVTAVAGVVLLSPGDTAAAAGEIVQVSKPGSVVVVKVSQPVAVSYGSLLVSSGTAGELTVTANGSLTVTAGIVNFQALETKTTSSTDQFVIARQLR